MNWKSLIKTVVISAGITVAGGYIYTKFGSNIAYKLAGYEVNG